MAKPYTEDARYWMKIQIANLFGEDKVSFSEQFNGSIQTKRNLEKLLLILSLISGGQILVMTKKWQLLASILDYFEKTE